MRLAARSVLAAFALCLPAILTGPALAETRIFVIANQPDGYGVDLCLARGERCGTVVARSYCQAKDFVTATAFRRVDPGELTGAVPNAKTACTGGLCGEYVAITCQR